MELSSLQYDDCNLFATFVNQEAAQNLRYAAVSPPFVPFHAKKTNKICDKKKQDNNR